MKKINEECVAGALRVLERGVLFRYGGTEPADGVVTKLEEAFGALIGRKYCVAVNSCSSGILLALLAAGLLPGDQVLVPAFTFVAVPSAVVRAGGVPVLVDMTEDLVVDINDLERRARGGARFLLLSYMRGRVPNMDNVLEICRKRRIILIEDTAHSLGVLWRGSPTGTFGRAAVFSTQSYKLVDSGEGGLLVTDDEEVALRAAAYSGCYETNWRKHGWAVDAKVAGKVFRGAPIFNFRMTNLTAAVILPQLAEVESRILRYATIHSQLVGYLGTCRNIVFPAVTPGVRPVHDSMQFFLSGLSGPAMRAFEQDVRSRGVDLSLLGASEDNARCFWNWTFVDGRHCSRTRDLLQSLVDLRLPLHMEAADVRLMGSKILDALGSVRAEQSLQAPVG